VTRNMTSRARPMRDPSDETTQFLTALVGFLRRQGYLPGQEMETGNFYHFYRLGAHDRRLTLNYDDAPWTMVQEQRLDDGLWVAMAPAQTVRDFVIDIQSAANDSERETVWPVLGTALNEVLRHSHGWIARLDESTNDNRKQTILLGTEAHGVQRRLTVALTGPNRGEATLEMLSHGSPSEWLPLDRSRLTTILRAKDASEAVATFLRLA
jgi:hypothetical protein